MNNRTKKMLILKQEPKKFGQDGLYKAYIDGHEEYVGEGESYRAALGNLIITNQKLFNVEIKYKL